MPKPFFGEGGGRTLGLLLNNLPALRAGALSRLGSSESRRSVTCRMAIAPIIGLILLASGSNLSAQTSLTVVNTPGYPATTVAVPIRVLQATNLVGAQFDLAFDPAKSSAMVPSGVPPNAGHLIRSREIAPGVRRTVIYSLNNSLLQTNGFIVNMPFYVPLTERVGSGSITPENVKLVRLDASTIEPVTLNSGSIFVRPVNRLPDGTIQFFLPAKPNEHYTVQATTDFIHWVNLTNVLAFANFLDLVDADARYYPCRFYRSALTDALGSIGPVVALPNGSITFQIAGLEGRTYVVQASTNLLNWQSISTNTLAAETFQFTDLEASQFRQRFYRLVSK